MGKIRTEPLVDGTRLKLPSRGAGAVAGGIGVLVTGVVFAGVPFFVPDEVPTFFAAIFGVLSLPIIAVALWVMFGRTGVEVTRRDLRVIETLGPLRFSRARPLDRLREVAAVRMQKDERGQRATHGFLRAEFEGGGFMRFALFYPIDVLDEAAAAVVAEAELVEETVAERVEVVTARESDRRASAEDHRSGVPKPASSEAVVERNPAGLVLKLPPVGIRKGGLGLFGMAVFWNLICVAMLVGLINSGEYSALWFLSIFFAIGIVLILIPLNMGRRYAMIAVIEDSLLIKRTNLFGTKSHEWAKADIAAIRAGPSNIRRNNVPVRQLQIYPRRGEMLGLWAGREDDELDWIASALRDALGVPAIRGTDGP